MSWAYARTTKKPGRVLSWSVLIAVPFALALLLQAMAAGAVVETGPAGSLDACLSAGPATTALADGDDVYIVAEGETLLGRFRIVKVSNANLEFEEIATGRRATVALTQDEQAPPPA